MDKIIHIARKEVRHILRDPRSLVIAILMPLMMTFLYGYAINLDIKHIELAIIDLDQSFESRRLIDRFYTSDYFVRPQAGADMADPELVLKRGDAHAVLVIRPGFGEAVVQKAKFDLGLLLDGADANMAAAAGSYASVVFNGYLKDVFFQGRDLPGVTLATRVLYNPDLKSSHFFVPGLIAVILMMISALLTSITIAREKETGSMEQLLTAPVAPYQIIVGKVLPYVLLALLDGVLVLLFAVINFKVPFAGSTLLLFFFGVIYVIAALSLGVLISTLVKTQQVAMTIAQVATVLPSVMLSGFIFDIKNMPIPLQVISHIIPARYFLEIIRGIMLRGAGIEILWMQAGVLVLLTLLLLGIAVKKFQIKID